MNLQKLEQQRTRLLLKIVDINDPSQLNLIFKKLRKLLIQIQEKKNEKLEHREQ